MNTTKQLDHQTTKEKFVKILDVLLISINLTVWILAIASWV